MPAQDQRSTEGPIFDAWTPISFKRSLGEKAQPGITLGLPTWVGTHSRRLMAYQILQAYIDNASRHFLATTDSKVQEAHREYGDAALMRDMILSALLGEDQQVKTERADEYDLHFDEDEEETEPDNSDDPEEADSDEPEPQDPEVVAAWNFQEWARQWAEDERFRLKIMENERNSVGLGDGCYSLGWSADKSRVRLRVWDPGFYFPVLDDGNEDDYPSKVHVAWELLRAEEGPERDKVKIRRITWELIDWEPWTPVYADAPVTKMCVMSDGTWTLDLGGPQKVDDLTTARVEWAKYDNGDGTESDWEQIPLEIDFIPVVHIPNNIALLNHFGTSSIARVLQILDDLANADTDLNKASATTGNPVIALSGATLGNEKDGPNAGKPKRLTYKPGEVIETGDGKLDALDTSKSLDALVNYVAHLLDRLSVNGRLPDSLLGRVQPSEVPSGVALALSFGPLKAMIEEMRIVRGEKYPLLFKMAWRISKVAGMEGVPERWVDTDLELGSFLPSDLASAINAVKELLGIKPIPAISLETAILMLIQAGLPVQDAAEEVRKIEERAFEAAVTLLDATGDEAAVFDFLNREAPELEEDSVTQVGVALPNQGTGVSLPIQPPAGVPTTTQPQPGEVAPPTGVQ